MRNNATKNTKASLWKEGKKAVHVQMDYRKNEKWTHEKLQKNLDKYFKKQKLA